jgi:hypothetical protein
MYVISQASMPLKICKTIAVRYTTDDPREIECMQSAFNDKENTKVSEQTFASIERAIEDLFFARAERVSVRQYIDDEVDEPLTRFLFQIAWGSVCVPLSGRNVVTVAMTKYLYSAS